MKPTIPTNLSNLMTTKCLSSSLGFLVTVMLVAAMFQPAAAQKLSKCPVIVEAIPLLSAIAERSTKELGMYVEHSVSVTVDAGQQLLLSSTPDGIGRLSTDDLIQLTVFPSEHQWEYDFRNPTRTRIVSIPPKDVTEMFVIGENTVEITAFDLLGPVFSSRPYYLVVLDTCLEKPTPTDPATSTPTISPTPTETDTPTATNTPRPISTNTPKPTATNTPRPTATPTNTDTPTLTRTPTLVPTFTETATSKPTATPSPTPTEVAVILDSGCCTWPEALSSRGITPPFAAGFGLGLGIILWLLWQILNRLRLPGGLEITDLDTGNTQYINLRQFGAAATAGSGSNAQIQLSDDSIPDLAGRFVVQQNETGMSVVWQTEKDGEAVELEPTELTHQSVIQLGRYRLTYQNYSEAALQSESIEGGIWHEI